MRIILLSLLVVIVTVLHFFIVQFHPEYVMEVDYLLFGMLYLITYLYIRDRYYKLDKYSKKIVIIGLTFTLIIPIYLLYIFLPSFIRENILYLSFPLFIFFGVWALYGIGYFIYCQRKGFLK